jgi:endo-1,4-beta-mannosidase
MGFEPTIPASERAKTVHALDGAATMIGLLYIYIVCYLHFSAKNIYVKGNHGQTEKFLWDFAADRVYHTYCSTGLRSYRKCEG